MGKEKEVKVFNPLSSKKVLVKYIMNYKNGVTQKDHPIYGGKLDVATDVFYVKKNVSTDAYMDPFTEDERKFVASQLGIEENRLSPHALKNSFWDEYTVSLNKLGETLNLSNVEDFIKLKVLLTNDGLISPNFSLIKNKPSYRYYIVDEEEEITLKSESLNSKKDAYINYGKIESDKVKLSYIIWRLTERTVASNTKIDTIQAQLEGLLDTKTALFNKHFTDKLFEYKVLIYKGMINGVISRKSEEYYMEGSPIMTGGTTSNLENTAAFLADPINQEIKFLIEDRIKNTKE